LVVAVTLLILALSMMAAWRDPSTRDRALLLTLWLFVPLTLLVLVSLRHSLFLPRAILFVAPAFALLIGCGVDRLISRSRLGAAAVLGTLLALNVHALYGYCFDGNDWIKSPLRDVSGSISREFRAGDVVIHSSQFSYRPFQFYVDDKLPGGFLLPADQRPGLFGIIGDGHIPAETAACHRLWLVVSPDFLRPGFDPWIVEWMNAHHRLVKVVHNSQALYVGLYERSDPAALPSPAVIASAVKG
jgi:hypothetical protein